VDLRSIFRRPRLIWAGVENRPLGDWTADTVDVFRSVLGPGGSRYTTLAAIPLLRDSLESNHRTAR
jgi:2'-5' RNA ligase